MSRRPVLLLEFNEIVPDLVDRFIQEGHLPNFAALRRRAREMVTDAQESQEYLEPWIQWITVHTGLTYAQHGVSRLNEGASLEDKCLWDLVSERGGSVWVCGSMNVRYDQPLKGMLLPDAWSTTAAPYPDWLSPFYRFLQTYVQQHTNPTIPLTTRDYWRFVRFLLANGLSRQSTMLILQQLAGERLGRRQPFQRAVLLDQLQWDVFAYHYQRLKPQLATFFSNSTAHFQHRFWRNMEPHRFTLKPSTDEQTRYQHAIRFGYQQMDRLIGACLKLAGNDAVVVLLSALSQQPYTKLENEGGKRFYRPRKFESFRQAFQLPENTQFSPVMAEQFHLRLASTEDAQRAANQLRSATVDGQPALHVEHNDDELIFCGCQLFGDVAANAKVEQAGKPSFPFYDVFYQADSVKSGMHHPDGVFWIADPTGVHERINERVPLRNVAPTILSLLDIPPTERMSGRSVLNSDSQPEIPFPNDHARF